MVRFFTLLSGIVLTLGFCQVEWAAASHLVYPPPSCPCGTPNVANFGYFPTTWREWPCEDRPEITNPRAVGAEVLRTPEGREQLPLPQGTTPPQPPSTEPKGGAQPMPGAAIPPPQAPGTPLTPPTGPKSERPSMPPSEGGLPGLPVEPDSSPSPGLPKSGQSPAPSLDLNPPSRPANDVTKPVEDVINKEKPQPKEETKSKEQPSLQGAPKPSATEKPLPGAQYERTPQTATTVVSFVQRDEPRDTAPSPVGGQRPEPLQASPGTHYADPITATTPESSTNRIEPTNYKTQEPAVKLQIIEDGNTAPPVALNGYCPVELSRNGHWIRGDRRWTAVHKGWLYLFCGPTQRQQFLANPDVFAPVRAGADPVLATDQHQTAAGQTTYCTTYNGRLYMFSSAATQAQFNRAPQRYAVDE